MKIETESEAPFAAAKSTYPSLLRSAAVTERVALAPDLSTLSANVPSPLLMKIEIVSEPWFAATKSIYPSLLRSAAVTEYG